MPFSDRTGPNGMGPQTGRGLGRCAGGASGRGWGRGGRGAGRGGRGAGYGRGRGAGFGWERGAGYGRGGGAGFGWGRGAGYARGMWDPRVSAAEPVDEVDERASLKELADRMERDLASIRKRLSELDDDVSDT